MAGFLFLKRKLRFEASMEDFSRAAKHKVQKTIQ